LQAREEFAAITKHFQSCHIPDEAYLHTLVLNAQLAGLPLRVFPTNHALFWDGCGSGPDMLTDADLSRIRASRKFFARKFPLIPEEAIRQAFLQKKPSAEATIKVIDEQSNAQLLSDIREKFCENS